MKKIIYETTNRVLDWMQVDSLPWMLCNTMV